MSLVCLIIEREELDVFRFQPKESFASSSFFLLVRVDVSDQARLIVVLRLDKREKKRETEKNRTREREQESEKRGEADRRLSLSSSSLVCLSCVDKFTQFYFLTANMRLIVNARTIFFSFLKIFFK